MSAIVLRSSTQQFCNTHSRVPFRRNQQQLRVAVTQNRGTFTTLFLLYQDHERWVRRLPTQRDSVIRHYGKNLGAQNHVAAFILTLIDEGWLRPWPP